MDLSQMLRGALPKGGELRYGFELAGLKLVPAARVLTELVAEARVFPVPKASSGLAGVINLRGTIVPLLDRRTASRGARHIRPFVHRALVLDREDHRVGLLLDGMPQLLALVPAGDGEALPAAVTTEQGASLKAFLTTAWARVDQPDEIWWEFNHRLAFESLAQANMTSPRGIEEVIE